MGSRWRKAKLSLGLNLCVYVPKTLDDYSPLPSDDSTARTPDSAVASPASADASDIRALMPTTPTPASSGLRLSKSGIRSSKKMCAICLATMKPGHGHALFTAECSHVFHFHCIASNVKHGNHVCPVCRAKWKEIPFQGLPSSGSPHETRVNPGNWLQDDGHMHILRQLPRAGSSNRLHHATPFFHNSEPGIFNDDEPLDNLTEAAKDSQQECMGTVEIKAYPEFSEIPQSASEENFTILTHLKAPLAKPLQTCNNNFHDNDGSRTPRAPVDLITVLDVSGSMSGTKLALLKKAMGFVIHNLGPSDRLSLIAFSSTARRLFPLRRMTESGRQDALQAVNSLTSNGGTNIADGLRKGAKVIEECKEKNPISSIILLSDGQDTYTIIPTAGVMHQTQPDCQSLVPSSIRGSSGHQVPVHVFGFGADHDSVLMHSISEASGGTFSFIEAEAAIQDAFAMCIGGLLSVVVQQMHVEVECLHPGVHLGPIKSGSYASQVADNKRRASIAVGDLYADEERDFLVAVNVPPASEETPLLKIGCVYRDPVTKEAVRVEDLDVYISRPAFVGPRILSIEVDRQKNRIQTAEAMAEARAAAERGELSQAVTILEEQRKMLSETLSGQSGDRLCLALDAELREMQERMANQQRYEASGRAFVLSGLSSHSWQRATTRGNSMDSGSLVQSYQTPSMVDMLQRSQTMSLATQCPNLQIRHAKSFPARLEPR